MEFDTFKLHFFYYFLPKTSSAIKKLLVTPEIYGCIIIINNSISKVQTSTGILAFLHFLMHQLNVYINHKSKNTSFLPVLKLIANSKSSSFDKSFSLRQANPSNNSAIPKAASAIFS